MGDDQEQEISVHIDKKILKYIFIAVITVITVGFFVTFEGYKPKSPQDNTLSKEQLSAIKNAGQDPENLKILGTNTTMENQNLDPTKLNIEDIKIGGGQEVKTGDTVSIHYTGKLLDGTKFDSSKDRNQPFSFTVGAGQVIEGWEKGLVGMKVGGERKLTIPASMGYGATGVSGVIPPNSVLIFEIELLKVL